MPNANGGPASVALARVDVGGHPIAVPVADIVQVMPRPSAAPALPRRDASMLGMVACRGSTVPLVDLHGWAGFPPACQDDTLTLALGRGDRTLAVAVSAVHGVHRVAPDALRRLHHDDRPGEAFQIAVRIGDGTPTPVLDVERLMAQSATWVDAGDAAVAERTGAPAGGDCDALPAAAGRSRAAGRHAQACFAIGGARLAVVRESVQVLATMPALRPVRAGRSGFSIVDWRDAPLAVYDLADLVPGAAPLAECTYLLVLGSDRHAIGVGVTKLLDFASIEPSAIVPVPAALGPRHGLTGVAHRDADGPVWLLDADALMRVTGLGAMRGLRDAGGTGPASGTRSATGPVRSDRTWLVFEAGGLHCVAADGVREIVRLTPGTCPSVATTLPWHGRTLPVTDLRDPKRRDGEGLAVVAEDAGGPFAWRIEDVHAIVTPGQGVVERLTVLGESLDCLFWGRGGGRCTARVLATAPAA